MYQDSRVRETSHPATAAQTAGTTLQVELAFGLLWRAALVRYTELSNRVRIRLSARRYFWNQKIWSRPAGYTDIHNAHRRAGTIPLQRACARQLSCVELI